MNTVLMALSYLLAAGFTALPVQQQIVVCVPDSDPLTPAELAFLQRVSQFCEVCIVLMPDRPSQDEIGAALNHIF